MDYNATRMGEVMVTCKVQSAEMIDFALGDYCEFRGERFYLAVVPSVTKQARSGSYGAAFEYESVKFLGCGDDLTRCRFLDVVIGDNGIHYSSLPKFSFFAATIDDFARRVQANLDRLYPNEWVVDVVSGASFASNVQVTIDNKSVWEAMELVSSVFKSSFVVREQQDYLRDGAGALVPQLDDAGKPYNPPRYKKVRKKHLVLGEELAVDDAHLLYGQGEGFENIKRTSEENQQIITRLRAYGSTKNLPAHYYNAPYSLDFRGDSSGSKHLLPYVSPASAPAGQSAVYYFPFRLLQSNTDEGFVSRFTAFRGEERI